MKYDGLIRDYLTRFEELNSRVGLTGQGLQDLILQQITPEIGRAIYHKAGTIPDYDAPISAIRECRIIEEEFTRDNTMKRSSQKNPDSSSGGTRVLQANLEINNQESRNPVRATPQPEFSSRETRIVIFSENREDCE